jgi:hypothetical protein
MIYPNIQIYLEDELLTVTFDLSIEDEITTSSHPDDPITYMERVLEIVKIRSVHVLILDKEDVNITSRFEGRSNLRARLEARIMEEIEYKSLDELKAA